ncbi:hypothetical protein GCM10008965_34390 [Methylorubrum aminovorans]
MKGVPYFEITLAFNTGGYSTKEFDTEERAVSATVTYSLDVEHDAIESLVEDRVRAFKKDVEDFLPPLSREPLPDQFVRLAFLPAPHAPDQLIIVVDLPRAGPSVELLDPGHVAGGRHCLRLLEPCPFRLAHRHRIQQR